MSFQRNKQQHLEIINTIFKLSQALAVSRIKWQRAANRQQSDKKGVPLVLFSKVHFLSITSRLLWTDAVKAAQRCENTCFTSQCSLSEGGSVCPPVYFGYLTRQRKQLLFMPTILRCVYASDYFAFGTFCTNLVRVKQNCTVAQSSW